MSRERRTPPVPPPAEPRPAPGTRENAPPDPPRRRRARLFDHLEAAQAFREGRRLEKDDQPDR